MSSTRRQLEDFLASLDVAGDLVIDIGGAQKPVKGRTNSWDVERYYILDLEEPHAGSPIPDITENIEEPLGDDLTGYSAGHDVNVVFCLEVFDYIVDPVMAFHNIEWLLAESGIAYISFPFIYPIHNPVEHEGLRYTKRAIERLAEKCGLEMIGCFTRHADSDLLQQLYVAEGMRAAKGEDHSVTGYICTFRRAA